MDFKLEAEQLVPELIKFRRYIHENAETGFDLPLTTKAITSRLDALQIPWEIIGGGIVATVGKGDKQLLLRSEMDALPMAEENNLPFRSKCQRAHMCGHDMNATMLLGTVTLLKKHESELKGQLVALWQPNEEGTDKNESGAERVVRAGFFKKYPVKDGFHFHLNAKSPLNYLNYGKGKTFASSTTFYIHLYGKSAHGSRSYEGKDPLNASIQLYNILHSIVNKEIDVFKHVIFYMLPMSANTVNMVPDEVTMNCHLLCYDYESEKYLMQRFREAAEGVAMALRIKQKFEVIYHVPLVETSPTLADELLQSARKVLPDSRINDEPEVKRGAEDMAYLADEMDRVCSFFLGAGPDENTPYEYGQHSTKVVFNEKTLPVGVALESTMVFDYLNKD